MNILVFLFIGLYALLVLIVLIKLCLLVLQRRSFPVPKTIDALENLSLEKKASFMMDLVIKGWLRNHRLHNNAAEYNDSLYLQSYIDFMNNDRNIEVLKTIKGEAF
jgi:hypothetical protein